MKPPSSIFLIKSLSQPNIFYAVLETTIQIHLLLFQFIGMCISSAASWQVTFYFLIVFVNALSLAITSSTFSLHPLHCSVLVQLPSLLLLPLANFTFLRVRALLSCFVIIFALISPFFFLFIFLSHFFIRY